MSVMQAIVVFVLIPLVVVGVVAALTLWPVRTTAPRYRPGQEWDFEPVWWNAHPSGHGEAARTAAAVAAITAAAPSNATARGGARGTW